MLQIKRIFSRFLILFFLSFALNAQTFLRTSIDKEKIGANDKIFVAIDFKVPSGEHITSPVGKGKPLAPGIKWENAEVLEVFWPKSVDLPNTSGGKSEYSGYDKDFTLLYSLKINDVSKPIKYDMFYVICGDACKPVQHSGELSLNGLLLHDEIGRVTGKEVNTGDYSFILMILFGLLGGIILNCMPCVFPIISMKIFGIIKSSEDTESSVKKHGVAFSIGVISTFLVLGSLLLVLRQSMPSIGWGFYMQDPSFVVCLLIVFLLCSLNFFGLYNLNFAGIKGIRFPVKNIYIKSFFS